MDISIIDESEYFSPTETVVFIKAMEIVGDELDLKTNAEISIVFVDDSHMRELNHNYRNLDKTTDVLSFSQDDPENIILGDIVISVDTAGRHATKYGVTLGEEIVKLLTHGVLHLLGHDHKKRAERGLMRQKEKELLSAIKSATQKSL